MTIQPGRRPSFESRSCIGCGHCASFCPVDAFGLGTVAAVPRVDPGALLELLRQRRSVRRFLPGGLDGREIDSLLETVGFSPTGTNACGLRVAVLRGEEVSDLFESLRRIVAFWWRLGPLRLLGALSGMHGHLGRIAAGEDLVFRGAPAVLFFLHPRRSPTGRTDAVIVATLVMVRAEAMGLGTLWNGVAEMIYRILPSWRARGAAGCRIGAVLCLGRPLSRGRPLPPRDWTATGPGRSGVRTPRTM